MRWVHERPKHPPKKGEKGPPKWVLLTPVERKETGGASGFWSSSASEAFRQKKIVSIPVHNLPPPMSNTLTHQNESRGLLHFGTKRRAAFSKALPLLMFASPGPPPGPRSRFGALFAPGLCCVTSPPKLRVHIEVLKISPATLLAHKCWPP